MNVKYGMQYYTLSVVLPYFCFIHRFDSLTRSNGGISTGEVRKIKHVCQVLKLMRSFSEYFSNTFSQGMPPT